MKAMSFGDLQSTSILVCFCALHWKEVRDSGALPRVSDLQNLS